MIGHELRFNKEFYSEASVQQALSDWSEVGTFEVTDTETAFVLALATLVDGDDASEDDIRTVLGEFQNYLLGVETQRRRQG